MSKPSNERQRELIEQYKDTPKQMGVYCIRNLATDRRFIAASKDIRARFNRHKYELRTGVERLSDELQQDWIRLGADNFEFIVLDVLEPLDEPNYDPTEDLELLATLLLEKMQSAVPMVYNLPVG